MIEPVIDNIRFVSLSEKIEQHLFFVYFFFSALLKSDKSERWKCVYFFGVFPHFSSSSTSSSTQRRKRAFFLLHHFIASARRLSVTHLSILYRDTDKLRNSERWVKLSKFNSIINEKFYYSISTTTHGVYVGRAVGDEFEF